MLDQFAAMLLADAVEHFGGVESSGYGAGPAFALEHPTEQDGEDLVRVDEIAVLVGGADAVCVAVGAEAGLAVVGHGCLAERADVRLDGLGVDAGEERVDVAANLDMGYADAGEDVGDDGAARAIHRVDAELHAGFGDEVEVGEAFDCREIGRQEIDQRDGRGFGRTRDGLAEVGFDLRDDGGLARAAVPGFVFDAIPLRGIVRGSDHDAAGGFASANTETEGRRRRNVVCQRDRDAGGRYDFSAGVREGFGAEAGIVPDAKAFGRVFVRATLAGVNIGGHSFGGDAHIGEGVVVGDDAAPAVGTKLDLRMRHSGVSCSWWSG